MKKIDITIHLDYEIEDTPENIEIVDNLYLEFDKKFKDSFRDLKLNNVFIQKRKSDNLNELI